MNIEFAGQTLQLLPEKGVIWKEEKTLIISDLHLGKIANFRKEGIAIPASGLISNFIKLDQLILNNNIWRIIFTGDIFHSDWNYEWEIFCEWRAKYHSIEMHIVKGNHDFLPEHCYHGFIVHDDTFVFSPFTFTHHPSDEIAEDIYIIAGHIHPVIRLTERRGNGMRLPCYYFTEQQLILPSFGYFTGGHAIQPTDGDRIIAIVNSELMDVTSVF